MNQKVIDGVIVFTDGACSGNPGPGGWGSIIYYDGEVIELGGGEASTTNNRMELQAVITALQRLPTNSLPVHVFTDSVYVIRGITQWIWGWMRKGWKTAEGEDVSNKDLWQKLFSTVNDLKKTTEISWHFSRGHIGIPGNERCDEIAVAFSKGQYASLYRGSLLKYSVAILDLPENTDLPEMKAPTEKKVAYSYLSNLGGMVYRHKTWASCERRVKGQSGAKFKKAESESAEVEILKSWGLSEKTPIHNSDS